MKNDKDVKVKYKKYIHEGQEWKAKRAKAWEDELMISHHKIKWNRMALDGWIGWICGF